MKKSTIKITKTTDGLICCTRYIYPHQIVTYHDQCGRLHNPNGAAVLTMDYDTYHDQYYTTQESFFFEGVPLSFEPNFDNVHEDIEWLEL